METMDIERIAREAADAAIKAYIAARKAIGSDINYFSKRALSKIPAEGITEGRLRNILRYEKNRMDDIIFQLLESDEILITEIDVKHRGGKVKLITRK